jgi:hypothetical protein
MLLLITESRLLDEGPPESLLLKYHLNTLEDVFLHLCRSVDVASFIPPLHLNQADPPPKILTITPKSINSSHGKQLCYVMT